MRSLRRGQGFTLIESLVALLLVTMLAHRLALQLPGTVKRLQAGNASMRAIESSLETLRAGNLPLMDDVLMPPVAYPDGSPVEGLILVMDVEPAPTIGLHEVTIEARYMVGQQTLRRSVKTMVWRPLGS
ncbi:MAG: type II secretion system protein [Acidobacteria bacterium]|nr:MAG: type II secretion system protein [Acidobacteriota bacterium]